MEDEMIPREVSPLLRNMSRWFPVLSVTGPRQSGKSTILKDQFPDYEYLNLETRNLRISAQEDPVGFIHGRGEHLFIDEAQYAPEIFAEIQAASDERGSMGQYVLSGSQNFLLLHRIDESLAGRVGIVQLLPLSYAEASTAETKATEAGTAETNINLDDFMFRGGYPHLYEVDMPPNLYFRSYITTYVQRDVSGLVSPENLTAFRTFLRLCAHSAGQLLNIAHLAAEAGITYKTAKAWLSLLESSYILFLLPPYASNARKRLTKTPKLYFHDTGLLSYLLGLTSVERLLESDRRGDVFENLIIEETLKRHLNAGVEPQLCFYRDSNGVEVDLVDMSDPQKTTLIEIKSGQTARGTFARHLATVGNELGVAPQRRYVVYRGGEEFASHDAVFLPAQHYLSGGEPREA